MYFQRVDHISISEEKYNLFCLTRLMSKLTMQKCEQQTVTGKRDFTVFSSHQQLHLSSAAPAIFLQYGTGNFIQLLGELSLPKDPLLLHITYAHRKWNASKVVYLNKYTN